MNGEHRLNTKRLGIAMCLMLAGFAYTDASGQKQSAEVVDKYYPKKITQPKQHRQLPNTALIHEHANTVADRFPRRVRSSWFGGLLRWRARTSWHTGSGCEPIANSHPVSTFCAARLSAPVESDRAKIIAA